MLCVGESYSDFENKKTLTTIKEQLNESLSDIHIPQDIIIAYEPLWAIGSGKTPNPTDVNEINEYIKDVVQSATSNNYLPSVCYGGSVDVENAGSFFEGLNSVEKLKKVNFRISISNIKIKILLYKLMMIIDVP